MGVNDFDMLRQLHGKIDQLFNTRATVSAPEFKVWKSQVERLIAKHCGESSIEYSQFKKIRFAPVVFSNVVVYDEAGIFKNGLMTAKGLLECFMEEWEVDTMSLVDPKPTKVFIVHGHDELMKHQVARLVEQQGLEPVILSEKENEGKTIIEKIERFSDVGAAIILFTPDDSGKANTETDHKPRARQNVVFEAGFFMGKLGREKTIMVVTDKNLELPSDLHGVVYTSDNYWQFSLIKEMHAMGFNVDMNLVKF